MDISILVSFGKFTLDLIKEISSVIKKENKAKSGILDAASLLELYGGLRRLSNLCAGIKALMVEVREAKERLDAVPKSHADSKVLANAKFSRATTQLELTVNDFIGTMHRIGMRLNDINLQVLDIYHPAIPAEIVAFLIAEVQFIPSLKESIHPIYHMPEKKLDRLCEIYHNIAVENRWAEAVENIAQLIRKDEVIYGTQEIGDVLTDLSEKINACYYLIGQVIRNNWDLKELMNS
jgi:hypothetical protein